MIRITLVLLVSTTPAFAGRHCAEVSDVVGYQQCSRYGSMWSGGSLWWELGLSTTRVEIDPIDRDVMGTRVISASGTFTAIGPRMRNLYGLREHFYVGSDAMFGDIGNGPRLASDGTARGDMPSLDQGTSGAIGAVLLLIGARFNAGPVRFGLELASGAHFEYLTSTAFPSTIFASGGFALETRAEASVWLSAHWSAIGLAGLSLLDSHDASLTVGLGFHAFPFDGGK